MTPPDLQALAAECEARAAAGETPRCEWNSPENDRGFFRVCHGDEYRYVDEHDRTTNVSKIILPSMIVMSANVGFSANVAGIPFFELSFSSALAGQLFCEAVTWRAYAPLAPLPARAAHVEALAFAAKVLAAMQEFGRTAGDADTWMCELGDMAMKSGFLCEPPEWNLTDLGRQLLADAATLARPKEPPMPEPTDPLLFGGQIQGGPPRQPSPCADCGADELAFGFGTHSWKCGSSTLNGMKHVSRECLDRQLTALRAAVARLEGERDAWKLFLDHVFHFNLNAGDFFGYACADAIDVDDLDLPWILPLASKYGHDGIHAAISHIAKCDPIAPHMTPKFLEARADILASKTRCCPAPSRRSGATARNSGKDGRSART